MLVNFDIFSLISLWQKRIRSRWNEPPFRPYIILIYKMFLGRNYRHMFFYCDKVYVHLTNHILMHLIAISIKCSALFLCNTASLLLNPHNRHSITRPRRRSMGPLDWGHTQMHVFHQHTVDFELVMELCPLIDVYAAVRYSAIHCASCTKLSCIFVWLVHAIDMS